MKPAIALEIGIDVSSAFLVNSKIKNRIYYRRNRVVVSFILSDDASRQVRQRLQMDKHSATLLVEDSKGAEDIIQRIEFCIDCTSGVSNHIH